jgi:hypothetical protein
MVAQNVLIGTAVALVVIIAVVIPVAILVPKNNDSNRSGISASTEALPGGTNFPTILPSSFPSLRPSDLEPSASPSIGPSAAPSDFPSGSPSAQPSPSPTSAPTLPPVDPNFEFNLMMHWEREFFWQEEYTERTWCMECMKCNELSGADGNSGCRDSNSNSFDCDNKDQLWLQDCGGRSKGTAVFTIVRHDSSDQIRVQGSDLCLTLVRPRFINLQPCDEADILQRFRGFDRNQPFDLRPVLNDEGCLTQSHHPRAGEVVFNGGCELAYFWNTALWDAIPA